MPEDNRMYCRKCCTFLVNDFKKHESHGIIKGLDTKHLNCPSTWIEPRENDKKEAQYLFSQSTITSTVNILKDQKLT